MKKIAFLFPGQGSQSIGMGEELYRAYDVVRETFDMASDIKGRNIARLCFKGPMAELLQTGNLQPAITAVNLGCLRVLRKEGRTAAICAGHSLGEFSALCAAGVVNAETALRLVTHRGALMQRDAARHSGTMKAVVGLTIDQVTELVERVRREQIVAVGNHNAERQVVITGTPAGVDQVSHLAQEKGARCLALKVSGAWHSELIADAGKEFAAYLETFTFHPPLGALILNVTGKTATDPAAIKAHMAQQLCRPVQWHAGMQTLFASQVDTIAEVGPGKVLSGMLRKSSPPDATVVITAVHDLKTLEAFFKQTA